ncbi:27045_t:CDS:2, partial [Dentiscutata erythropus]
NPNDLKIEYIESNSSSPKQSTSYNNSITVIANSLDEVNLIKKHIAKLKLRKIKVVCGHNYELTTGTRNLKAYLHQVHRILPPEGNNKNIQLTNIVSNQPSLHDFINKKTPLPSSKQEKIINRILAWVVDDL